MSSFQVGTEVVLDKGYLAFNDLTLTAYSDPLPVTAGGQYQALAQVTGAVTAGVGQGGRILAVYKDGSGQSAGSDVLWRNPLNFSGTAVVQDTFSANANAATMQLALESDLDAGHLTFSNLGLQHLTASDVIRRSTYSVGGQATAVKVQGDPEAGRNGIFFLYSDHLGSTSVMSYGYNLNGSLHPQAGQKVEGSEARYLPFGGWRGTTPTAGLTDRGYTGHKSNNLGTNDIGLIYMNARFYAPGVSRFVTADTIVPNAVNPQSFNRYSYTLNNPLIYTDPTGHAETGACGARGEECAPEENWQLNAANYMLKREGLIVNSCESWGCVEDALYGGVTKVSGDLDEFMFFFGVLSGGSIAAEGIDIVYGCATGGAGGCVATVGFNGVGKLVGDALGWLGSKIGGRVSSFIRAANPCSFSSDTLVMTEDGLVPISQVTLETLVLAYNEETGEVGYYPVVSVWAHEDPVIVLLTISGETIETTPNHPFYTADGEWVQAGNLQPGDEIRDATWGTGTVEAITFTATPQTMYNFTVATAHTYFVGDGQWLVHNDCLNDIAREYAESVARNATSRSSRPGTIAVLRTQDGQLFYGTSGHGNDPAEAIMNIINQHPFNFGCAEIDCINRAAAVSVDLQGATITTVSIRGPLDNPVFNFQSPCSGGCDVILNDLGIRVIGGP